jgi:hypothetical protein
MESYTLNILGLMALSLEVGPVVKQDSANA